MTAREAMLSIRESVGAEEIAISVVTLVELQHGVARANTPARRTMRAEFLAELMNALTIYPVTIAIALQAGQIDGENKARGFHLSLADLLIGTTALDVGYGVATRNIRHFETIAAFASSRFDLRLQQPISPLPLHLQPSPNTLDLLLR